MCFVVQKSLILFLFLSAVFSSGAFAQRKSPQVKSSQSKSRSQDSSLTWDLGASFGNYGGSSYSQVDLGLNWHLTDYLNWRNDFFSRFGSSSVAQATGLDSSVRFEYLGQSEGEGLGYRLFAGPGIRISNSENTGFFGEAGAILRFGGLNIGGGVKALQYTSPGRGSNGQLLPSSDVSYILVYSGGGAM